MRKKLEYLKALRRRGLPICTIKLAEGILKDSPRQFDALVILSGAQTSIQMHHEAIRSVNKAIEIAQPHQEYRAFVLKAFIYQNMGSSSGAVDWYTKASRKQPLTAIDLAFMGDCMIKSGNFS